MGTRRRGGSFPWPAGGASSSHPSLDNLPRFNRSCPLSSGSDFVLKFADGVKLHTHKLILSKWSSVLAEAVQLDTGGELDMHESSSLVWRTLLAYMYPVEIEMHDFDLEFVIAVVLEANKYDIQVVEKRACKHLLNFVSVCAQPQLFQIAGVAGRCGASDLMEKCNKRMQELMLKQVEFGSAYALPQETWQAMKDCTQRFPSSVMVDLLRGVVQRSSHLLAESRKCPPFDVERYARIIAEMGYLDQSEDSNVQEEHLQRKIDDLESCIEEAGCFVSKKWNLCFQSTKRPVAEVDGTAPSNDLKAENARLEKRVEDLESCIEEAGCFVSKNWNLCFTSTNRPITEMDTLEYSEEADAGDEDLESRVEDLEACIEEAGCFVSNNWNLCFKSCNRPVAEFDCQDCSYESSAQDEDLQKRIDDLEACIEEAGCFISNRWNLCLTSTNRPVRDCI